MALPTESFGVQNIESMNPLSSLLSIFIFNRAYNRFTSYYKKDSDLYIYPFYFGKKSDIDKNLREVNRNSVYKLTYQKSSKIRGVAYVFF